MDEKYSAAVAYEIDGGKCEYTRNGFESVYDATEWAFSRVTQIAHNWGEIQPDGLEVMVNVFTSDNDNFCDCYSVVCG